MSSACSTPRRFSTINCCASAAGSPTTISLPIGEVFRTMLPLSAEFKRVDRISHHRRRTDGAASRGHVGIVRALARTPEEQAAEFRVLDYLGGNRRSTACHLIREEDSRAPPLASRKVLLTGMVRKKWIVREDVSAPQDATRTVKIAVLKSAEGKLNDNQRRSSTRWPLPGGRVPVEALQSLEVPRTTLGTLVKRGLVEIIEEPADFTVSRTKPRPSPFDVRFQRCAAVRARASARRRRRAQVFRHVAARRHRFRQDRRLSGRHACGPRSRTLGHPAGPGNRSDARRRRRPASDLRRRSRNSALRAL